jgi:hypothetical protein
MRRIVVIFLAGLSLGSAGQVVRPLHQLALARPPVVDPSDHFSPEPGQSPAAVPASPRESTCQALQEAALSYDLPIGFFTRLIWQESRFDQRAVSRVGAQGIAQFMPETAAWVGLANPFDPAAAIAKSAALLHKLKQEFGNLGLAAAAYNAGPKRVDAWLGRHRSLPSETQTYVWIVTGHTADEWSTAQAKQAGLPLPAAIPCLDIPNLFAARQSVPISNKQSVIAGSPAPRPAWAVQLIGSASPLSALASFYQLQKTYRTVLGSYHPLVIRSKVGVNAFWYRVRIGADNRTVAERLCSNLRAVGGSCLVQPN